MGCPPLPDAELTKPVNELEAVEDQNGVWRNEINQYLKKEYAAFFSKLNFLAVLQAPAFEIVYSWRRLQEEKLRLARPNAHGLMNDAELKRFIQHYERITRYMLIELPAFSDAVLRIDENHEIISISGSIPLPDEYIPAEKTGGGKFHADADAYTMKPKFSCSGSGRIEKDFRLKDLNLNINGDDDD